MLIAGVLAQVSDEGDVLYSFPKDYRSKLAAKSLKIKLEPLVEKGKVLSLCLWTNLLLHDYDFDWNEIFGDRWQLNM